MELITKAQIISEFMSEHVGNSNYDDFFVYNDLGVPLAVMYINDGVLLKETGKLILEETYKNLCEIVEADNNKVYKDYDEFILDSIIEDPEEEDLA